MNNQENQLNQLNTYQQPQPSFQSQPPKKFSLPIWASILITAVAIIVVSLAIWAAYRAFVSAPAELPNESPEEKQVSSLPAAKEITPADETANWQTYRNDEYGYEIKYPLNRALSCAEDLFKGELRECSYIGIDYVPADPSYMYSIDKVFIMGFKKDNNIRSASIEKIAEYTIKEIKSGMYKNQIKTGEELLSYKKSFFIQERRGISYETVDPIKLLGPYFGNSGGRGDFGIIEAKQKISFIDNNDEFIFLYTKAGSDESIEHSFFNQILSTFKFIK